MKVVPITAPPAEGDASSAPEPADAIAVCCMSAAMDAKGQLMHAALRAAIAQAITAERAYWQARLAAEEAKTAGWWE